MGKAVPPSGPCRQRNSSTTSASTTRGPSATCRSSGRPWNGSPRGCVRPPGSWTWAAAPGSRWPGPSHGAGHEVTGIDVSGRMVALARQRVPAAWFEQCDVRDYQAPEGGFDAVCAFFPLLMMTRAEASSALRRMAGWLAPGGYLVSATVPADVEDAEIVWMGRRARVSSFPAEQYVRLLREDCGLDVLHHAVSAFRPDVPAGHPEEHLFCYARRPCA